MNGEGGTSTRLLGCPRGGKSGLLMSGTSSEANNVMLARVFRTAAPCMRFSHVCFNGITYLSRFRMRKNHLTRLDNR